MRLLADSGHASEGRPSPDPSCAFPDTHLKEGCAHTQKHAGIEGHLQVQEYVHYGNKDLHKNLCTASPAFNKRIQNLLATIKESIKPLHSSALEYSVLNCNLIYIMQFTYLNIN